MTMILLSIIGLIIIFDIMFIIHHFKKLNKIYRQKEAYRNYLESGIVTWAKNYKPKAYSMDKLFCSRYLDM